MRAKAIILAGLVLTLCQCTKETVQEGHLVIDGWIENGCPPVVMVTSSLVVGTQNQWDKDDLAGSVITDAEVLLSDGEKSVVLTGIPAPEYFPPFIYTTKELLGEPGKTYTLKVRSGKQELSSATALAAPSALDKVWAEQVEEGSYLIHCRFTPRKGECYGFFTRREGKELMYLPAFMSLIDGDAVDGVVDMALTSGIDISSSSRHQQYFSSGERVSLRFCSIDRRVYDFWKGYEDAWLLTHNPFFPVSTDVPTNITGGYGLWAGYSCTYYELLIP